MANIAFSSDIEAPNASRKIVAMTENEREGRSPNPWRGASRVAVGRALLRLGPAPASASQIAMASGRDQSNCKRLADELVDAGPLLRIAPEQHESRRGRRTTSTYTFAQGARERFVEQFGDEAPGGLRASQQLVFLDIRRLSDRHLSELDRPQVLASAAWSAVLDGERQELVIAFEGEQAVEASLDLLARFSTAELAATRATVAKVDSSRQLWRWVARVGKPE